MDKDSSLLGNTNFLTPNSEITLMNYNYKTEYLHREQRNCINMVS